jgi:hypothetical protein
MGENVDLWERVASLPLTVLLVLVLVGGYVEYWIYGSIHREQINDLERRLAEANERAKLWEDRFLRGMTDEDPPA